MDDFDEWADLYRRDPAGFEARRQAVLAIELARGGNAAAPARALLRRLDAQLDGQSDAERLLIAFTSMAASLGRLGHQMTELGGSLHKLRDALSRMPGRTDPGCDAPPHEAA
jgi:hypothetical protein